MEEAFGWLVRAAMFAGFGYFLVVTVMKYGDAFDKHVEQRLQRFESEGGYGGLLGLVGLLGAVLAGFLYLNDRSEMQIGTLILACLFGAALAAIIIAILYWLLRAAPYFIVFGAGAAAVIGTIYSIIRFLFTTISVG